LSQFCSDKWNACETELPRSEIGNGSKYGIIWHLNLPQSGFVITSFFLRLTTFYQTTAGV